MAAVSAVRVGYAAIRLYGMREIRAITPECAAQAYAREPQSVLRPWYEQMNCSCRLFSLVWISAL